MVAPLPSQASRHVSTEKLKMLLEVNPASIICRTRNRKTALQLAKETAVMGHPNHALIRALTAKEEAYGKTQSSDDAGSAQVLPNHIPSESEEGAATFPGDTATITPTRTIARRVTVGGQISYNSPVSPGALGYDTAGLPAESSRNNTPEPIQSQTRPGGVLGTAGFPTTMNDCDLHFFAAQREPRSSRRISTGQSAPSSPPNLVTNHTTISSAASTSGEGGDETSNQGPVLPNHLKPKKRKPKQITGTAKKKKKRSNNKLGLSSHTSKSTHQTVNQAVTDLPEKHTRCSRKASYKKPVHVLQLEGLPKLLMLDLQKDNRNMVGSALKQLSLQISNDTKSQEDVIDLGGHGMVLLAMRKYAGSETVQEHGLMCISFLVWDRGSVGLAVEKSGGLEAALNASLTFSNSEPVQFAACCAVGGLLRGMRMEFVVAQQRFGHRLIFDFDGIEWILTIMKRFLDFAGSQNIGCQILTHMLSFGEESKNMLQQAGVVARVSTAVNKHPQDADLQKCADNFMAMWRGS